MISPHWRITGIAFIGMTVSSGPIFNYTFGLFLIPIAESLSWQRGDVSILFSSYLLVQAFFLPIAGYLADRIGAREVVLPSIIAFAVCLFLLGSLSDHMVIWCAVFLVLGVAATGSGSVPYAKVLSAWHDRRRGLALGIAAAGTSVGAAVFPAVAQSLIVTGGWRSAYVGLGIIVLVVGLPIVWAFLRNTPQELGLSPDGLDGSASNLVDQVREAGLSVRQSMRVPSFWILAAASVLSATAILGTNVHFPSYLFDHGLSEQLVVGVASAIGVSSLVSRLVVGWSLDRISVSGVAIVCFSSVAIVCSLIALEMIGGILPFVYAGVLGFAIGAEVDIVAYATSRYFGQRNFSQLYGYLFAAFIFGASIGPVLMGKGYDISSDYIIPFFVNAALMAVCALLMSFLGPYKFMSKANSKD